MCSFSPFSPNYRRISNNLYTYNSARGLITQAENSVSSLTRGRTRLEIVIVELDIGIRPLIVHLNVGRDLADVAIQVGDWWIAERRRSITPAKKGLVPPGVNEALGTARRRS